MAITALHAAATGLRALSTQIDVVANNLANAETTAFKGQRVNFEDLFYQTLKQPGTINGSGDIAPSGIYVGLGTRISNTQLDLTQGSLENTGGSMDVGIQGPGFFKVKVLDTLGNGTAYTRNGQFFVNNKGQLVIGMGDGYNLDPPIVLPTGVTSITISQDGNIEGLKPDGTTSQLGQIKISQFVNPQGLQLLGGSLYQETESSGPPIDDKPGDQGAGLLLQNYLESSNVDPVKELVTLIKTQRAFELNSQSIQTADQALQTVTNLRRS
ncbi:MAG: flagellar basal-body rod protein FlgG [Tepidisphaeraceae bacterium]|jgi:flagellar basal-body rod protein FlgG